MVVMVMADEDDVDVREALDLHASIRYSTLAQHPVEPDVIEEHRIGEDVYSAHLHENRRVTMKVTIGPSMTTFSSTSCCGVVKRFGHLPCLRWSSQKIFN